MVVASHAVHAGDQASWPSGMVSEDPEQVQAWRGSAVTVVTRYFGKRSWEHLISSTGADPVPGALNVIGFPMLPDTHRGELARCAAGGFDSQIRQVGEAMVRRGWSDAVIRLGWEANRVARDRRGRGSGGFAWAAEGDGSTFVGCWQRWVDVLDETGGSFQWAWNMANDGNYPGPVTDLYPGDDYVDMIGANFFDRCPPVSDKASFDEKLDKLDEHGGPAGPRAWRDFAREHGKPYILPEWGVGGSQTVCRLPGLDNPKFIALMHGFFSEAPDEIGFECYFGGRENSTGTHELMRGANPLSASMYKRMW